MHTKLNDLNLTLAPSAIPTRGQSRLALRARLGGWLLALAGVGLAQPAGAICTPSGSLPSVSVSAVTPSVDEGAWQGKVDAFKFERSSTTGELQVHYSLSGTAKSGEDYKPFLGVVTFLDGSSQVILPIELIEDGVIETTPDEMVILTLDSNADYEICESPDNSATLTLNDNDAVGVNVLIPLGGLTTTEGGGKATFDVVLTSEPQAEVTLTFTSSDLAEGRVSPSAVTFAPEDWNRPRRITVTGQDDAAVDNNVPYSIVIPSPTSIDGAYSALDPSDPGVVNYDNDNSEQTVTLRASTNEVAEGGGNVIIVTRTSTDDALLKNPLVIYFDTTGTATPGIIGTNCGTVDYKTFPPSATLLADNTSLSVPFETCDDDVVNEGEERVVVRLKPDPTYAIGATDRAVVSILDNESTLPIVEFGPDQVVGEGLPITLRAWLDHAVPYPIEIPYTVTGNAKGPASPDKDHDATDGVILINGGTEVSIKFNTYSDSIKEFDSKNAIFTMGIPVGATYGPRNSTTVYITDNNHPLRMTLTAEQGGRPARLVTASGGPVTVTAAVVDPNPNTAFSPADWASSNSNLVQATIFPATTNRFTFDPSGLSPGYYRVRAWVQEANTTERYATVTDLQLQIAATTPGLQGDDDDDGIASRDEGYGDVDHDGIPNFLDDDRVGRHILPGILNNGKPLMTGYLLKTFPGLSLRLGNVAHAANGRVASINEADIGLYGAGQGMPALNAIDTATNYSGHFDFEVQGLTAAGGSVYIVIPLINAIPTTAVYRQFTVDKGWTDFIADAANNIYSATGSAGGQCPAPGASDYHEGLGAGNYCLQLKISDGGINDGDGMMNYSVRNLGGVAIPAVVAGPESNPQACSGFFCVGRGGTAAAGAYELGVLGVMLFVGWVRRRRLPLCVNISYNEHHTVR